MAANKSKGKKRLVIQLDPEHRKTLDKMKGKTGASFSEIIRRLISKAGGAQ